MDYFRPIAMTDAARPAEALPLAGGWCWFSHAEVLGRAGTKGLVAARDIPPAVLARLTAPRPALAGLEFEEPRLMGILNVTPDSFSDGGRFDAPGAALAQARVLLETADILDIGGESTRPGAEEVPVLTEVSRTAPLIAALRQGGIAAPISIDTRKAPVAHAALAAGASLINDVSALGFDRALGPLAAASGLPICLMHAQGTPADMQKDPQYDDVLLDVYDWLEERITAAEAFGINRSRIIVDPGIGFGKTVAHNLTLIRGLSLFHGLGCVILLGASRKRFIGSVGKAPDAQDRGPGTIAVTLAGLAQGVQIHRVHDTQEAKQALRLWQAVIGGQKE